MDPSSIDDECEGLIQGTSLEESTVPQSPSVEMNAELKVAELSSAERWLKLEVEVCVIIRVRSAVTACNKYFKPYNEQTSLNRPH